MPAQSTPCASSANATGGVVQARHKTKDGTYTKNKLYYVAAKNPFELYAYEYAKPPQPASIFDEVAELSAKVSFASPIARSISSISRSVTNGGLT